MLSDLNQLKSILSLRGKECQLVVAIRGGDDYLIQELKHKNIQILWNQERFFLLEKTHEPLQWVQWYCHDFEFLTIESIKDAVTKLKNLSLLWSYYSFDFHRRHTLIHDSFKYQGAEKRIQFPVDYEKFKQNREGGFWTLLESNLLLVAKKSSSWKYLGEYEFQENKEEPPSRAYLKLWEIFMKLPSWPSKTETVMDLGACPGGWTWVLKSHAKEVYSVDKAPLASTLMNDKKIIYLKESIFALDPKSWLHIDWLFCDVICYPEKILQLIKKWLNAGFKGNFVFTIKFQGETNFSVIEELKSISGSKLEHLYHNKHELTWIYLQTNS
jgi:23S rRNA (cytidine2498-2'-O)-methyltransferase